MKTYKVTVDEFYKGQTCWYNEYNQFHREDGPAIECADGTKFWYKNNQCHREDGPAVEEANGTKSWWKNGQCHREDGPAIEYADGRKYWFINGKELTEAGFNSRTKSCDGKFVEVDGVKYKLVKA